MSEPIPRLVYVDTMILRSLLRTPKTIGDGYRNTTKRLRSLKIREFIGRVDFLASRELIRLSFPNNMNHPLINITEKTPDRTLEILAVVKRAHNLKGVKN